MTIIFLKTHLPRWLLLVSLTLISGCTSFGPKGTENFDHTFSRTIEPEELLEHYTRCNVYAGTYMEGEMASVPVFEGMLVVTDHRLIFTQWDKSEQRYKPLIWIQYKDIKKAKKQNDSLLQYVAIVGPDNSKNTYHIPGQDVEWVYQKIREQVGTDYHH